MRRIGFNVEECRENLQSYLDEIQELMELVADPANLSPLKIEEARNQLKNLKECLRSDHTLRNTVEGQAKMTNVESAIFAPTVHQVLSDLHISVASRPSQEWFSELYSTTITIQHALANLNEWGSK